MASRKSVMCGSVRIGGGAPVSIQSMTNTDTHDVAATVGQIKKLMAAGCDIVRVAVPDAAAAAAFGEIKKELPDVPVVADIHFDYRLAVEAIERGADGVRINPGNIGSGDRVRAVVRAAKERGVPIRVGVNSGSLEKDLLGEMGVCAEAAAESALRNVRLVESAGFDDIVISVKCSDTKMTFDAYRIVSERTDHPLHIGVTEAGTYDSALMKSAVGLGGLLMCGIGDTMRVSITGDPVREPEAAMKILQAAGIRKAGINFVSCPTCGRTKVGLAGIAEEVKENLTPVSEAREKAGKRPLTVAVMGCEVNGPGEAAGADIGVACGDGTGLIFIGGEPVRKVDESEIASVLTKMVSEME